MFWTSVLLMTCTNPFYDIAAVCNHLNVISMQLLMYMHMTNIPKPWSRHCPNPPQEVVWVKRPHPVLLP